MHDQLGLIGKTSRWIREKIGRPKLGITHFVELECPNEGETFGTEETEPVHIKRNVKGGNGIWTYECDVCGELHAFLWGPPAPIHVEVPEEAVEEYDGR